MKKYIAFSRILLNIDFFKYLGGVRLSPLGTSATNWPIVPAPGDRWWWVWSSRWNENWQGKPKYWEKTCPSATLSTTKYRLILWRSLFHKQLIVIQLVKKFSVKKSEGPLLIPRMLLTKIIQIFTELIFLHSRYNYHRNLRVADSHRNMLMDWISA
jgi:hypothetical protein